MDAFWLTLQNRATLRRNRDGNPRDAEWLSS